MRFMKAESAIRSNKSTELCDTGITKLLYRSGLQEEDTSFLNEFRKKGFSVLLHGSGTADEITETSDIDFAVIGDLQLLPNNLLRTLTNGSRTNILDRGIDYISLPHTAVDGRKMSMHYINDTFRKLQPQINNPLAYEFRMHPHTKDDGISRYLLPMIDSSGDISLARFTCPQEVLQNGVINTVPQTGIFTTNKEKATTQSGTSFDIEYVLPNSNTDDQTNVMVLGLEFDKMYTERAIFTGDDGIEEYAHLPLQRSYAAIGKYLGVSDACKIVDEALVILADNWSERRKN